MTNRHILLDNEDVLLELEPNKVLGWCIHCTVHNWSKSLYSDLLIVWDDTCSFLNEKGIEKVYACSDDPKVMDFAERFGFSPSGLVGITDLEAEHDIWVCETRGDE